MEKQNKNFQLIYLILQKGYLFIHLLRSLNVFIQEFFFSAVYLVNIFRGNIENFKFSASSQNSGKCSFWENILVKFAIKVMIYLHFQDATNDYLGKNSSPIQSEIKRFWIKLETYWKLYFLFQIYGSLSFLKTKFFGNSHTIKYMFIQITFSFFCVVVILNDS